MATWYVDPDAPGPTHDGTSWNDAYLTLAAAVSAKAGVLSEPCIFNCRSGSGSEDTAAVNITGYTTSEANYVEISTEQQYRHNGAWDTSAYRLNVVDAIALAVNEDYVTIDGIQITNNTPTASNRHVLNVASITATNNKLIISNCIIKGHNHATLTQSGMNLSDTDSIAYIFNTVVYGVNPISNNRGAAVNGTVSVYSSNFIGGQYALRGATGTFVAKNVYGGGSLTEDINGTWSVTTCATEDGSEGSTVALDNDTFVDYTGDYHLAVDGLSPLQGAGTDTSGEGAPLNFTTDIDGQTRDATWDIGADADYSAGSSSLTMGYRFY